MLNEFKKFALRGSVIDLAVGIIIGAAFNSVVNSLVKDVITPPIGLLLGKVDFSNLYINLSGVPYDSLAKAQEAGAPTINYGLFLNAVVSFLVITFVVFLLVQQINRCAKNRATPANTKECPYCLSTIALQATRCPHCTSELPPPQAIDPSGMAPPEFRLPTPSILIQEKFFMVESSRAFKPYASPENNWQTLSNTPRSAQRHPGRNHRSPGNLCPFSLQCAMVAMSGAAGPEVLKGSGSKWLPFLVWHGNESVNGKVALVKSVAPGADEIDYARNMGYFLPECIRSSSKKRQHW